MKETVESNLRAIQRMRARDASDNDQRHKRNEANIMRAQSDLADHSQHFDSIGQVIVMLIENINMQMEGESADLRDRKLVSLFGAQQDHQTSQTQEVITLPSISSQQP